MSLQELETKKGEVKQKLREVQKDIDSAQQEVNRLTSMVTAAKSEKEEDEITKLRSAAVSALTQTYTRQSEYEQKLGAIEMEHKALSCSSS